MSELIELPGTGNMNTKMSLLGVKYCLLTDLGHSVLQLEQLRQLWKADKNRKAAKHFEHYHVTNSLRRVLIPKILLVVATKTLLTFYSNDYNR